MGLHKDFPKSPYDIIDPDLRWVPDDVDVEKQLL
jgi:hypothetical protein